MSALSKEYLLKCLISILPTEEQMKSVSMYIKTFKGDSKTIVEGWVFVYHKSSIYHKLNLLYLANEIIQTTRDMDPDSISLKTDFKKAVKSVFPMTKEMARDNPKLYKKYTDLENVWIQRNVLILENEGVELDALLKNIESSFSDKNKLAEVLEIALSQLRKK